MDSPYCSLSLPASQSLSAHCKEMWSKWQGAYILDAISVPKTSMPFDLLASLFPRWWLMCVLFNQLHNELIYISFKIIILCDARLMSQQLNYSSLDRVPLSQLPQELMDLTRESVLVSSIEQWESLPPESHEFLTSTKGFSANIVMGQWTWK